MYILLKDIKNKINISDNIFCNKFNEPLVHQVIVSYSSYSHQGSSSQKSRSEVSGSGKKPWKQKGSGKARSGSFQSPIWRSGGVTFASKKKNYKKKINKKMYKGALKCIFSELLRQDRLIIVKTFNIDSHKTKNLVKKLNFMMIKNVLIIKEKTDKNIYRASKNLYKINLINVNLINPVILISFDKVLITLNSIKKIEVMLS
ncbi:MAG: 50S ribosomal protein L4 [Candidatus Makana argininalis]